MFLANFIPILQLTRQAERGIIKLGMEKDVVE